MRGRDHRRLRDLWRWVCRGPWMQCRLQWNSSRVRLYSERKSKVCLRIHWILRELWLWVCVRRWSDHRKWSLRPWRKPRVYDWLLHSHGWIFMCRGNKWEVFNLLPRKFKCEAGFKGKLCNCRNCSGFFSFDSKCVSRDQHHLGTESHFSVLWELELVHGICFHFWLQILRNQLWIHTKAPWLCI